MDNKGQGSLAQKTIKAFTGKESGNLVWNRYFRILLRLKNSCFRTRHAAYLQAMSPEEVRYRLDAMGLKKDWVFADFDEVITEQPSQQLWAKEIVKNKKEAFLSIFWKYIHHFKWKENLYYY